MANGVITWNGVASDTLGIVVSKVPSLNRPQRKYNSYSVPGRNGDIVVMQDAYAEYEQEYEIFALDDAQVDARAIVDWLYQDGWCQLSDDWEPEYYRLAYFVGPVDIEPIMDEAAVCTITFRCRPQRYLAKGLNIFPKLQAGTYTNNQIRIVVDDNGLATVSGTSDAGGYKDIPLDEQFEITSDIVSNSTFYFNNPKTIPSVRILFGNSNETFASTPLDTINKTIQFPSTVIGKTVTKLRFFVPLLGTTVIGSFQPMLKNNTPTMEVTSGDVVENPTNHIAYPIITLTGNGFANMLNLEKPYNISFDAEVESWWGEWSDNIFFVDKDWAYDSWGRWRIFIQTYTQSRATSQGGEITTKSNATGTLNFTPPLHHLFPDSRPIGVGIGVTLTPDADYTITYNTTSNYSEIWIGFFENSGNKPYYSSSEKKSYNAGEISLTFHVPPNCSNTLIIFYAQLRTLGKYSNIRLTSGKESSSFRPYDTNTHTEKFTINNTTMQFTSSGFNSAVIDCEKENFTVDGANYNPKSSVLDQYGNTSVDYLKLEEGSNEVTYTTDLISSVSINPKFWEL